MIIKGKARGGAGGLAQHLQRDDTNERVQLKELRGVVADNLTDALYEMAALGSAARTDRPLYHASINAEPGQAMTDAQWQESIDALEKQLGLEGQPRAVVEHGKKGREHVHVVWMRVDLEQMKGISDSHNYRKHEEVARDLERRFGHDRVQGAHAERDGIPRPERTPSHDEMQRAARTGLSMDEAKAWVQALWQATDSGKAFKAALESQGWMLAQGRRGYLAVDPHGSENTIARLTGKRAADVRARLSDVSLESLPSVDQAKQQQRAIHADRINTPERQASHERTTPRDEFKIAGQQHPQQPKQSRRGDDQAQHGPKPKDAAGLDEAKEAGKETGIFVHDAAVSVTQRLVGFVASMLGAILNPGGASTASYSTESPAERAAAHRAQRQGTAALRNIRDSMERDEPLRAGDVRNLSPDVLENIRARGDAALLDSIRRMEEEQIRDRERGRTRGL